MVQVRQSHPLHSSPDISLSTWLAELPIDLDAADEKRIMKACQLVLQAMEEHPLNPNPYAWSDEYSPLNVGLEMAYILSDLHVDIDTLIASILYRVVREGRLPLEEVGDVFDTQVSELLSNVLSMAHIYSVSDYDKRVLGQTTPQSEAVRKMLVAMLDDVRVVLIKLAERCCALRLAKEDVERSQKLAREAMQIYIPLAHRLGIGQLKWELEDFAFRYLEPQAYKQIAQQLSEKRLDRQRYIDGVIDVLQKELQAVGIHGEITGRAKHIFSIWKKMQRKNIGFAEVYDIRAVRILVPEVKDCYTVLGTVHTRWGNISKEFDDYIAQPKDNGYRSLHTAVIGPEDKVLEIQIRTFDMHEEAELGVCAHWVYKGVDAKTTPNSYEEKLTWFRQAIESYEYEDALDIFAKELNSGLKDNRIYAFTPDGHVIELSRGATPLDFAYRIHTEVGHGCRGAKVNGKIVPLSYELDTGDQVEIIVEKNGEPNSEWLRADLKYLCTPRARLKVRAWFRQRGREQRVHTGRQMLEKEFKRLALPAINFKKLASALGYKTADDLFASIGAGDVSLQQVLHEAQLLLNINLDSTQEDWLSSVVSASEEPKDKGTAQIHIQGVGNLLTSIAACCKPLPGDPIRGFITQGRGVSVHRQDCHQLLGLENNQSERILDIDWGSQQQQKFSVDVLVESYDRTGLIRDISTLLANEQINVTSMQSQTRTQQGVVRTTLSLEVSSLEHLSSLLARLSRVSNVINVIRLQS